VTADAIVIGAGPNGLVAANLLADAGWDVVVLEAQPTPGGAVRTQELTLPGFHHDVFSAFYPLGAGSPHIRRLHLEDHGLRWRRSEIVVAHPATDGSCASLSHDPAETEASLDAFAPGDGERWRAAVMDLWGKAGGPFIETLLSPMPPVRGATKLAAALGPRGMLEFARFGLLSVRRFAEENFKGAGAGRLLASNALHADITPDSHGGALFGWVLVGLGQHVGWPVPEGGAGNLAAAMLRRLEAAGGRVVCDQRVERILTRGGRAHGVRTADGQEHTARHAVLADVGAPALYGELLHDTPLPARVARGMRRFQYDSATFKVDWALDGPIPWQHPDAARAGTVHVTEGMDSLTEISADLNRGFIPKRPFLLLGQYAAYDPTRQPAGKETAWAYTHVPQAVKGDAGGELAGRWDDEEAERFADRIEGEVEAVAPGFRKRILGRHVMAPPQLEQRDANLVGGALNGGTAQLHQQLVFRPYPGLGRAETPVRALFLASASAHPGGGVHGGPGANAARAALWHHRVRPR
jgi:phytoene dehydrogenase-like protein